MKSGKKNVLAKCIIIIQMVLAAAYMFCSWDSQAIHMEKQIYTESALTLRFDEYTGVLYPVFLRFVEGHTSTISAYNIMVFLIQFLAVGVASFVFMRRVKKITIWSVIYLLTFPLVVQSFMSITPTAFSIAVFLIFFSTIFKREKSLADYIVVVLSMATASLLSKELYLIILITLILALLYVFLLNIKKNLSGLVKGIVVVAIGIGLSILVCRGAILDGINNKMPGSMGTGLMCNMAAEHFEEDYYFWPENVKVAVPFEKLADIVKAREYAVTELGKIMSETLSYKEMKAAAWGIFKASAFNRSKETINLVSSNFFDYLAFPLTITNNMNGQGKSISDIYFLMYKGKNGTISRVYLLFGLSMFLIMIALNVKMLVFKKQKALDPVIYQFTITMWVIFTIYASLVAYNYFDYFRIVPFIALMLMEFGAVTAAREKDDAGEKQENTGDIKNK